jgi:membrane-associated protein
LVGLKVQTSLYGWHGITCIGTTMEALYVLIDFFLHLDLHLASLFETYGFATYLILFLVIFCETGLIVTPFLPGDSLLFAVGALLTRVVAPEQGIGMVLAVCACASVAAILGDAVNYTIGYRTGPVIFSKKGGRFFNSDHLHQAHLFYQRHGGKTIIMARFIPIIRTFAPFVAGIGKMAYARFAIYNVTGGVAWVFLFIFAGYFFGNVPMVKNNFTLVILAIIGISILPVLFEFVKNRKS